MFFMRLIEGSGLQCRPQPECEYTWVLGIRSGKQSSAYGPWEDGIGEYFKPVQASLYSGFAGDSLGVGSTEPNIDVAECAERSRLRFVRQPGQSQPLR